MHITCGSIMSVTCARRKVSKTPPDQAVLSTEYLAAGATQWQQWSGSAAPGTSGPVRARPRTHYAGSERHQTHPQQVQNRGTLTDALSSPILFTLQVNPDLCLNPIPFWVHRILTSVEFDVFVSRCFRSYSGECGTWSECNSQQWTSLALTSSAQETCCLPPSFRTPRRTPTSRFLSNPLMW